jgi:hypothetical protein
MEKTAQEIANSKHVCGGKGSICEFLRSKPAPEPGCKTTAKPKSPGLCRVRAKPEVPTSSCENTAKPKSPELCGVCAKPEVLTSNCENTAKSESPGPCGTSANLEFTAKPIIINHLQINFNVYAQENDDHCQPTGPALNSSGSEEKEHSQCAKPEFNPNGLKQEKHHHPCAETEQYNNPVGQLVCECFSMAEPYMLMR